MSEYIDIVRFRKDAFGGCEAINSYEDLPQQVRSAIWRTFRRAGVDGCPIEMEYARTMEDDPEFWEVKTVARKSE